jgi:hypothetical protein
MTPKKMYNCHQVRVRLHRNNPTPKTKDPRAITLRGPNRSTILPIKGPTKEYRMTKSEKAPAQTDRLHPNSLRRATKKTEKEYQIAENRPRLTKLMPTMIQL